MSSETPIGFADLSLSPQIIEALARIGYEQPSPIQAESIPPLLAGRDLLGTAQTGTGKTAAFALPCLSTLDLRQSEPQVLVLTPTRELAIQVAEAFQTYASAMKGFHVLPIYGGQGMDTQLRQLKRGAHVVVGTPGRVMDHLRRGTLKLANLRTVVLDEADEMLRMGFIDDVTWILEHTPEQRQVALFSATMPKPIRQVAERYLKEPVEVKIHSQTSTVAKIEQHYWIVSGINKLDALTRMLEAESFDGIIMFVRTKTMTLELAEKLEARGYSAAAINGDMTQALRERTIEQLKNGKVDILVATDVAARGIDVARISHVINYDIPYDTEAYVHRIGRTGRAGRSGKAILFVAPRERRLLKAIEKATGQSITAMELPTRDEVNQIRIKQFKQNISDALSGENLGFFHSLVQQLLDETGADAQQIAATLAYLLQKDNPLLLAEKAIDKAIAQKPAKERGERPERAERPERKRREREAAVGDDGEKIPMETFRLAVGYRHKVKPGDIVGAIANEADIESRYIGRIEFSDEFCTVDLPEGMPEDIFQHLKQVKIRGQSLGIERMGKLGGAAKSFTKPARERKPGDKSRPPVKPRGADSVRAGSAKPAKKRKSSP